MVKLFTLYLNNSVLLINQDFCVSLPQPQGILRIQSDGDVRRVFGGLKFVNSRIFFGKNILASIF